MSEQDSSQFHRTLYTAALLSFIVWAVVIFGHLALKYQRRQHLLQHPLPDFPIADSASRSESIQSLAGGNKAVVAVVSATCPHCMSELGTLSALQDRYREILPFIIVSSSDQRGISALRRRYPNLSIYSTTKANLDLLGLPGVPELLFLNNGVVVNLQRGERSTEEQQTVFEQFSESNSHASVYEGYFRLFPWHRDLSRRRVDLPQ